jgi:tRNA nucleotidyltransferase (CCA-adding enzyme)
VRKPGLAEVRGGVSAAAAALLDAVLAAADARETPVYLVGGPVRDLLLGRGLRDLDLLVDPRAGVDAAALARAAAGADARVVAHERFGTVSLARGEAQLDLASARRESYAHPGALPNVEAGSLAEDLQRRDFSVNALALPLSAAARAAHGGLVDADDGVADLAERRLRVLHARSFHDDPTRALRAARLSARLGFSLSRDSRSALRSALRDGAFGRVSGERLRREIAKLFEDAALGLDAALALRLLHEWHVLGALEPGLALERPAAAPLRRLARGVAQPPWPAARWRPWQSGLALWLAPLAPDLRRRALRRFAVRGEPARRVADFPKARDAVLRALARARGRGAVDALLAGLDEETLHALYAAAPPAERRRILRWATQDRGRRPPVTGDDLVAHGLAGPAVGRALARIRAAWLDGALGSRDEALALALEVSRRRERVERSDAGRGHARRAAARRRPRAGS